MKNTSWKTSAFGILLGIIIAALTAGLLFKVYNATDFAIAMGSVLSIAIPLWGLLQKDADKTGLPNA
jgi:hypothetical protein